MPLAFQTHPQSIQRMIVSFASSSCPLDGFSSFLELLVQHSQVAVWYSSPLHSLRNFEEQLGLAVAEVDLQGWRLRGL